MKILSPPRKVTPEQVDIKFPEAGFIISQPSEAIAAISVEKRSLVCIVKTREISKMRKGLKLILHNNM